jgi:hypothetical protein
MSVQIARQDTARHKALVARVQQQWIELQGRFAQHSGGKQVVVFSSGHGIPIEAPNAVTAAVREVVMQVRNDSDGHR